MRKYYGFQIKAFCGWKNSQIDLLCNISILYILQNIFLIYIGLTYFMKKLHSQFFLQRKSNTMMLSDKTDMENCFFNGKYLNETLPKSFSNWFCFASASHT